MSAPPPEPAAASPEPAAPARAARAALWALGTAALLSGAHEALVRSAGHAPGVKNDRGLWALVRDGVPEGPASRDAVLLLGASRMQAGADPDALRAGLGASEVRQLALSGKGSSFPVFADLVRNTDFRGTVLISETEATLAAPRSLQAENVAYRRDSWSVERRLDRRLGLWIERRAALAAPESDALRLWGTLATTGRLPGPAAIPATPDRAQFLRFERFDREILARLWKDRTTLKARTGPDPDDWLAGALAAWRPPVEAFRRRGGRVVFVRFPVPPERWRAEGTTWAPERYWDRFAAAIGVPAVHFTDEPSLNGFPMPDASHVAGRDRAAFSRALAAIARRELDGAPPGDEPRSEPLSSPP